MPPGAAKTKTSTLNRAVLNDPPDLRDRIYEPTLGQLKPILVNDVVAGGGVAVRQQGDAPTCAGHALAAVIEILLNNGTVVSADMLYRLAYQRQDNTHETADGGIVSLRSVVKTLYHNGVCSSSLWPDTTKSHDASSVHLTPKQDQNAREVILGAYFNLRHTLNEFHAALNEAGVIYVSAKTHDGWTHQKVKANKGKIVRKGSVEEGAHAFAIVGYTEDGFLVLNSWGSDWGHYQPPSHGKPIPGVALWGYDDWAGNIMDAWVLRLGVKTPGAFAYSIGDWGMPKGGASTSSKRANVSTRESLIRWHYVHLDDGRHVTTGAYPSSRGYVEDITQKLRASKDKPTVLLSIAGGTDGLDQLMRHTAERLQRCRDRNVYLVSLAWCSDFVADTTSVFERIFEDAEKQLGRRGDTLDALIERKARVIGRAFWRDVRAAAERCIVGTPLPARCNEKEHVPPKGDAWHVLTKMLELSGIDVHISAEGVGAYMLNLAAGRPGSLLHKAKSITLIAPTLTCTEFDNGLGRVDAPHCLTMFRPSHELEQRINMGAYGKTPLHLVARSFADPVESSCPDSSLPSRMMPPDYMGMACAAVPPPNKLRLEAINHKDIDAARQSLAVLSFQDFTQCRQLQERLFDIIQRGAKRKPRSKRLR
jgi:hypothetical protein